MAGDNFESFATAYDAGRAQIVFRRVVADLETPIGAYLKLSDGRHNTFLLESVQDGAIRGRYSMIGFDPDLILKVAAGKASINRNVAKDPEAFEALDTPPLDALRALVAESQADIPAGLPSTAAGLAFGAQPQPLFRAGAGELEQVGVGRAGLGDGADRQNSALAAAAVQPLSGASRNQPIGEIARAAIATRTPSRLTPLRWNSGAGGSRYTTLTMRR